MPKTAKNFQIQRDTLMRKALDVFVEKGFENTTMSQLQKEFNLSRGGMYHYFSSKEDILDAVIKYGIEKEYAELYKRLEEIPLSKKLLYINQYTFQDEYTEKLFHYKRENRDTLLAFKLREANTKATIELVEDIFCQCTAEGFYKTDYPKEMAAFITQLFYSIIEPGILPSADMRTRKERIKALGELFVTQLHAPHWHAAEIVEYTLMALEMEESRQTSK